jgi:hypothetical protein
MIFQQAFQWHPHEPMEECNGAQKIGLACIVEAVENDRGAQFGQHHLVCERAIAENRKVS